MGFPQIRIFNPISTAAAAWINYMKSVTVRSAWGGDKTCRRAPRLEYASPEAKNCRLTSWDLHLEHIFGPKWIELFILEIGLVKLKIEQISHDFPL